MSRMSVQINALGKALMIECAWVGVDDPRAPLLVFLHEGLGSLAMWKDFPQRLCEAGGLRGLVYSRPGYGHSTPRPADERWQPDFMHDQAREVLPALLRALGIDAARERPWCFGHSDGGSIALIHAALHPDWVGGLIVVAPHIFVEDLSVSSIEQARLAYLNTDLSRKLGRYHADADSAFWGWNQIWLDPAFRDWNIEALLPQIRCPVLAVQGHDDEYGTMAQIDGIARALPDRTRLLKLDACGHSPHRDQPEALIRATLEHLHLTRTDHHNEETR